VPLVYSTLFRFCEPARWDAYLCSKPSASPDWWGMNDLRRWSYLPAGLLEYHKCIGMLSLTRPSENEDLSSI